MNNLTSPPQTSRHISFGSGGVGGPSTPEPSFNSSAVGNHLSSSPTSVQQQQGATLRRLCMQGDVMLVRHMLANGVPVDAAQPDGCTGLWLAAEQGHHEVVRMLCERGANVNKLKQPGDVTPLYIAAQNGHTAVVRILLAFGGMPNAAKASGATPLYIAAQQNFADIVSALIDGGASTGLPNQQGITPLAIAAFQGNVESFRILLRSGADPDTRCGGKTALEWAASNGHESAIGYALQQWREQRVAETGRRMQLVRGMDVTPAAAAGAFASSSGGGNRAEAAEADVMSPSWYTPKFLVSSPSQGTNASRGMWDTAAAAAAGGPQTIAALRRAAARHRATTTGTTSAHLYDQAGRAVHHDAAMRDLAGSYPSQSRGGALTPGMIDEEANRNEAFRKHVIRGLTAASSSSTQPAVPSGRSQLLEVAQEWESFKHALSAHEGELQAAQGEARDGWMYSAAAMLQYEHQLKRVRQQQLAAAVANRDAHEQRESQKEKNVFLHPPLPKTKMEQLRKFVLQGASAKGPPPPPPESGEEQQPPQAAA